MKKTRVIVKPTVFVCSLIPLGWLTFALWSDTVNGTKIMTADPVQKLNRELGDWVLIFIIITLVIRPASEILKRPKFIAYRRMLGLFASFYAFLHFCSYVGIDLQFDWAELVKDVTKRNFIIVGFIGLMLMTPLVITSNKSMVKKLGNQRWRRLHFLIYPIAILGVLHFYMMVRADYSRPLFYGTIIVVLLLYRLWKYYLKSRSKDRPLRFYLGFGHPPACQIGGAFFSRFFNAWR